MRAETLRVLRQVGLAQGPDTLGRQLIVARSSSWRSPRRCAARRAC
jgi:hypothetical protein